MFRVVAAAVLLLGSVTRADCLCGDGGQACFVAVANSSFDIYTSNPTLAQVAWMRSHYTRMLVYSPAFDSRLAWYPNGWVYKDTYAIYLGSALAAQHPEWILQDAAGNKLYIPHACADGTCPQYAGDIGNPSFRANWITEAAATLALGYKGLVEDDFNMTLQVSDGDGNLVAPWDPRTGTVMTVTDWGTYLVQFQSEIRAAFPTTELVENQVWFFAPASDPGVIAATRNANYVWVERGFNDTAIVGGSGEYGFETLLSFVDAAHRDGAGVVVEPGWAGWGRDYALTTYFLFSNGNDGFSSRDGGLPDNWWSGYDVNLGRPLSRHYKWNGLFRRDFAGGLVLVNQPGSPTMTVSLGAAYTGLDGLTYSSVTLEPTSGIVLLTSSPATTTTTLSTTALPPSTPPCTTARCTVNAVETGPACAGQAIPASVVNKFTRAATFIDQGARSPLKPERRRVRKVRKTLKLTVVKVTRAATRRKPKLSSDCAAALKHAAEGILAGLGV